jgi:hypothetical protein
MKPAHFDKFQFAGKSSRPVRATKTRDGWNTTGVSYDDYTRFQTQTRKPSGERRLATPKWAVNDPLLQELLVVFMEERAAIRRGTGTLFERLEHARQAVIATHPRLSDTLTKLCNEYVELKKFGACPEMADEDVLAYAEKILGARPLWVEVARELLQGRRKRELEIEIEGIDTYLRYTQNGGADVLAGIVYLYYRAGLDSVGVGAELGLKPPHVRQLLWRLAQTCSDRFAGRDQSAADVQAENANNRIPEPMWEAWAAAKDDAE